MPCTKLRKSLHVGQAQQRKRKYKKGEERGENREREEFRQKIKADREKKTKSTKLINLIIQTWHKVASSIQKGNTHHICLFFVIGLQLLLVSIIKQHGVITCPIDQWQKRWHSGGLVS